MDVDHVADESYRVVQFTPPGSEGSIIFGKGVTSAAPGSVQGLYLIVFGIEEARAELAGRDVGVSEVFDDAGGLFYHGHEAGEVVHHAGGGWPARTRTVPTTAPMPSSATRTATAGCSRR